MQNFGEILNENWILKKSLSNKIADKEIDEIYNTGLENGALGGKVLGAGGGGFILFYCPKSKQSKLRQSLNKLKELNFKFDRTGAKIIYVGDLNKRYGDIMNNRNWLKKYMNLYKETLFDDSVFNDLIAIKDIFQRAAKDDNKIIFMGNGGSAAMASHCSVDLTKNAGIRSINFNESDLLTCFSNDYGYDLWSQKALEFYSKPGDVVVLISSSGNSMNIVNAATFSKTKKLPTITFTGFDQNNKTRQIGDINLWVNSKAYNIVEMTHHIWILSIVDMIIGHAEYSA